MVELEITTELERSLAAECRRYREALKRIANINSAIQLPYRNTSYSDYELRAIAREALVAPVGVEALESWRGE